MFDAAGTYERDTGDGLTCGERDILARWDAGAGLGAIAAATGRSVAAVEHVVDLYDDRPEPDWRERLAAQNDAFVAAMGRLKMTRPQPMAVGEIEALLEDRIEMLVHDLLPNARKEAHEMCVGGLDGAPGQSLRIHVGAGSKRGWWRDFAGTEKGDALLLIAHVLFGGEVKKAVQWAKSWLHLDDGDPARIEQHRIEAKASRERRTAEQEAERAKGVRSARSRWHQAAPLAPGDAVDRYLKGRGIDLAQLGRAPGAIRCHAGLAYGYKGPEVPAMVAMVTNLAGEHVATHRTWLDAARGTKAGPDLIGFDRAGAPNDPKKAMGSVKGGHIPLWKGASDRKLADIPAGTDVYVSEGIEDGLTAAAADPSIRVVCMLALGFLAEMALPPQIGKLIVLAQNDPAGSSAARALERGVAAQRAAGRTVLIARPPAKFKDWNDLAMGKVA